MNNTRNLIANPSIAIYVNDLVLFPNVHGYWNFGYGRNIDYWRLSLAILLKILLGITIIELFKGVCCKNLTIVAKTSHTCSMWKMSFKYFRFLYRVYFGVWDVIKLLGFFQTRKAIFKSFELSLPTFSKEFSYSKSPDWWLKYSLKFWQNLNILWCAICNLHTRCQSDEEIYSLFEPTFTLC